MIYVAIGGGVGIFCGSALAIGIAIYMPGFVHALGEPMWFYFSMILGATTAMLGMAVGGWFAMRK